MSEGSTYKEDLAFIRYIDASKELAENVRRNITKAKKGVAVIDDQTVVALRDFIVAYNAISDMYKQMTNDTVKFN